MQGGDAGGAPAGGEIFEIDARAIGGIEESPEAGGAERSAQAEVGERLQDVRETLVSALTGIGRDPQDGAPAAGISGDERGGGPAFFSEDLRLLRNFEARKIDGFLSDDGQLGTVDVFDVDDGDAVFGGAESEGIGGGGFALEDEKCALFDALHEMRGSG